MSISVPGTDGTACSLYAYFDQCETLLYVGITARGDTRLQQHAFSSAWWPLVRQSRILHYESRPAARAAEKDLIARHKPPFNRADNPDAWSAMIRYFVNQLPTTDPDHEHDPTETYARCSNCHRCTETDGTEKPLCGPCDMLQYAAYMSGGQFTEERTLAVARKQGMDLADALHEAKRECPW